MTHEEFSSFFDTYPSGAPVRELIRYAHKALSFSEEEKPTPDVIEFAKEVLDDYRNFAGGY